MSDTEKMLLREIIENREDDTPRLLYADYLEESGQEDRATFLRVQVELNSIEGACLESMKIALPYKLRNREQLLFQNAKCRGPSGLPERNIPRYHNEYPSECSQQIFENRLDTIRGAQGYNVAFTIRWKRGFIDTLETTCERFAQYGPLLVAQNPVTKVVLSDVKVGNHPLLRQYGDGPSFTSVYPVSTYSHPWNTSIHIRRSKEEALDTVSSTALEWALSTAKEQRLGVFS